MRLPEFAHATAFRWTLAVAAAFVMCTLLLFGFVYWQTASYMTSTVDGLLTDELRLLAADTPDQRLEEIDERLRHDPRRIRIAGLFGADAHRIAGNLESLPSGLVPDLPTNAAVVRIDIHGREMQNVRLAELMARPRDRFRCHHTVTGSGDTREDALVGAGAASSRRR